MSPAPNRSSKRPILGRLGLLALLLAGLSTPHAVAQTPGPTLSDKVLAMERGLEAEFETYFGEDLADVDQAPAEIGQTLARLQQETGTTPAVLWVMPKDDHLHLVLITPDGATVVRDLYDVPLSRLSETVRTYQRQIRLPGNRTYRASARRLHEWIIEPLEDEFLEAAGVDLLLLCLGDGARGLPMAALFDGEQYLIEKYSLAQIPAFNLIKTDYRELQQGQILAMGSAEFENQMPLPAVPIELNNILWELRFARDEATAWEGQSLLNQTFTLRNFNTMLADQTFDIVHLATHAAFNPGTPESSYLQLWDTQLQMNELGSLNWNQPPELLVLSACRTAVGHTGAELGFAGLALQSGAKSAVASFWNVNDIGTMALMSEFYHQLPELPTKSEALRAAQLGMLKGEIAVEDSQLQLSSRTLPLPETVDTAADLSHPYYWAGFTVIGSPW
ncbi:MAG: CHAT domain-containing protein [Cyanobacteria bacterium J06648_16]